MSDFDPAEAQEFRNSLLATHWRAAIHALTDPGTAKAWGHLPDTPESIEEKFGADGRKVWEELKEVLRKTGEVGARLRKGDPEPLPQPAEVQEALDQKPAPLDNFRSLAGQPVSMTAEGVDELIAEIDGLERRAMNAEVKANRDGAMAAYVDRNRRKRNEEGNHSLGTAVRLTNHRIEVTYVRWGTKYSFIAHEPAGYYPMTPETIDLLVSVHEAARKERGFPVPKAIKLPWVRSEEELEYLTASVGTARYAICLLASGEWYWKDCTSGDAGARVASQELAQEGAEKHFAHQVRSMIDYRAGSDLDPDEDPGLLVPDEIELYRAISELSSEKEITVARAISEKLDPMRRILRNLMATRDADPAHTSKVLSEEPTDEI